MDTVLPFRTIGDYALIGDCRSAALVSRQGSVDWLCLPRFDSPSLFGALLDRRRGGCFSVHPTSTFAAERRYLPDTNVLETTFRTAGGVVRLTDLMPVASEREKRGALQPDHQILRRIEGVEGEVEVEMVCNPRPDYARRLPRLRDRSALGIAYAHQGQILILRCDFPLTLSRNRAEACGRVTLRPGERRYVSLVFGEGEPAVIPPLGTEAERKIRRSLGWWERWVARCPYTGPHRDAVVRSALVLKLMTYAPSGAVVAAPTTSLPEAPGGQRNWDYRYCWLRDASLTLRALFDLGYREEAEAFVSWLLYATRLTWPEVGIVYDVHGETHLPERTLDHLEGFAGSRPVRVGNDAAQQFQLDIYGEVLDAVYEFVRRGGHLDRQTARLLVGLGRTVCRRWQEPDEGIWEIRAARRHHTYSKVMCWVALDRLLRLHQIHELRAPVERFATARAAIREEVERRGYNERLASYTATLDGDSVDASLLLLGRYGYTSRDSERMRRTCQRVSERLGVNDLLYRYLDDDGLPPGEGAFGICSFWGVACRALLGDVDGAAEAFEHILSFQNDVGLYAEEIDPRSGEPLGNFPQAFTHVGLIDAALTLGEVSGEPSGIAPRRGRQRS